MPVTTHLDVLEMSQGWRVTRTEPQAASGPTQLRPAEAIPDAEVPGTVAATLKQYGGKKDLSSVDLDDSDWWYECDFEIDCHEGTARILRFDGLATIVEVWLNDEKILDSRNMFRSHRVDVTAIIRKRNRLALVFRSINHDLQVKRSRPRWKTNLVSNQQLRWIRTTLLGRIPGWSPAVQPVGPWRKITLETCRWFRPEAMDFVPTVTEDGCFLETDIRLSRLDRDFDVESAEVSLLGRSHPLEVSVTDRELHIYGRSRIPDAPLWWPHTHGSPNLHAFEVTIRSSAGEFLVERGRVGFRSVSVDRNDGRVRLLVNGQAVFARGACWSTNDIELLDGDTERLRNTLELFRESGANMVRIGGTMVYESDAFYDICDELGLLVWQDFMFASMDYPIDDEAFLADVSVEVEQQIRRLRGHPSTSVLCGNSEVEQQAAMWGRPAEFWRSRLFHEVIPESIERNRIALPYFPSSPCEGALPFHNDSGISHYFGVGAYLRPISDAATAGVRFAAECLGFSNVPEAEALKQHFGSTAPAVHHPHWKGGIPRDSAAGWDFEDIRDHYLNLLYGIDPIRLRYADKERYIELSKVVTGEVIEQVFAHWRRTRNPCDGALIWLLKDLAPGAGWGIFDSDGRPKPVYYFLKRCWASVSIGLTDEGLNGLHGIIANETDRDLELTVVIELLRSAKVTIAKESIDVTIPHRSGFDFSVDRILGVFFDAGYCYRFGPPKHDVVIATAADTAGNVLASACHYPNGHDLHVFDDAEIQHEIETVDNGIRVTLWTDRFLKNVCATAPGHRFSDNYFSLGPERPKTIVATPVAPPSRPFRLTLAASNLALTRALQ